MNRTMMYSIIGIALLATSGIGYAAFTSSVSLGATANAGTVNLQWNNPGSYGPHNGIALNYWDGCTYTTSPGSLSISLTNGAPGDKCTLPTGDGVVLQNTGSLPATLTIAFTGQSGPGCATYADNLFFQTSISDAFTATINIGAGQSIPFSAVVGYPSDAPNSCQGTTDTASWTITASSPPISASNYVQPQPDSTNLNLIYYAWSNNTATYHNYVSTQSPGTVTQTDQNFSFTDSLTLAYTVPSNSYYFDMGIVYVVGTVGSFSSLTVTANASVSINPWLDGANNGQYGTFVPTSQTGVQGQTEEWKAVDTSPHLSSVSASTTTFNFEFPSGAQSSCTNGGVGLTIAQLAAGACSAAGITSNTKLAFWIGIGTFNPSTPLTDAVTISSVNGSAVP